MSRRHNFEIYKDPSGVNFRVHLGYEEVADNDILIWQAIGTAAVVHFPPLDGNPVVNPDTIKIPMGGTGQTTVVLSRALVASSKHKSMHGDVEIPYSVYCDATNSFAEGNSDPKIIVKGP